MGRRSVFTLLVTAFLAVAVVATTAAPTGEVTESNPDQATSEASFLEDVRSAGGSQADVDVAAPLRETNEAASASIYGLLHEGSTGTTQQSTDTDTTDSQRQEKDDHAVGRGTTDVPRAPLKTTYGTPAVTASRVVFEPRADLSDDAVDTDRTSTETQGDEPEVRQGDIEMVPRRRTAVQTTQHNVQPPKQPTVVTASPALAESITHLASEGVILKSTYPTTAPGKELNDRKEGSSVDATTAGQRAREAAPPGQPDKDGDLNKPGPVPVATARDDQAGSSHADTPNVGLVSGKAAPEASKSQGEGVQGERQQSAQSSEVARTAAGTASDQLSLLSTITGGGVLKSPATRPSEETGREDDVPVPKNGEVQRNSNVPAAGNDGQPNTARAQEPSQGLPGGSSTVPRVERASQEQPAALVGSPAVPRAEQPNPQQGKQVTGGSSSLPRAETEGSSKVARAEQPTNPQQGQPRSDGSSNVPRAEQPRTEEGRSETSGNSNAPRAEQSSPKQGQAVTGGSSSVARAEQPNAQQGQPSTGGSSSVPRAEQLNTPKGQPGTTSGSTVPRAEQPNAQQGQPRADGSSNVPRAEQPNAQQGQPRADGSSNVPRAEQPNAQQGQPRADGSSNVPRAEQPNTPATGSSNVPRAEPPNAQQGQPGATGGSTVPRAGQPTAQQGQPGNGGSSSVPRAEQQGTPGIDSSSNHPRTEQSNPQLGKTGSSSDAPRADQTNPQQGQSSTGSGSNVPRAAEPSPQQKQQGAGTNTNIPRAEQTVPQQGPQGPSATSNVPRAEQQNPPGTMNAQSKPEGPRTEVPKGPPPPSTGNDGRGEVPAAKSGEAGRTGDGKGKTTIDVKTTDPVEVTAPKDSTTKVTVEDKKQVTEDNKNPPAKKHETVESETHVAVDEKEPEEHTEDNKNPPAKKHEADKSETHVQVDEKGPEEHNRPVVPSVEKPEHTKTADPEPELEIRNVTVEVEPEQPDKKPKTKPEVPPPVVHPVQPVMYPTVYPPPLVVNHPYPHQPVVYQPYQPFQPTAYQPARPVVYPSGYQPVYQPVHHMGYGSPMPYHPDYRAHPVENHRGSYGSYQPQPQYTPAYNPYGQPHYQPVYPGQYHPPMSHDYTGAHPPAYRQPQIIYGSGHQPGPSRVYAPGPYAVQPLTYHTAESSMYGPQYQPVERLGDHKEYRRAPGYGGLNRRNPSPVGALPAVPIYHMPQPRPGKDGSVTRPVQPSVPHAGYKRDVSDGYAPSSHHFAPVVSRLENAVDYNRVSMNKPATTVEAAPSNLKNQPAYVAESSAGMAKGSEEDSDIYSHVPEASPRKDTNDYPYVVY